MDGPGEAYRSRIVREVSTASERRFTSWFNRPSELFVQILRQPRLEGGDSEDIGAGSTSTSTSATAPSAKIGA